MDRAGDGPLLRQIFVHRAGHCAFTSAETITAVQVLVSRLDAGRWDLSALEESSLNAQAAALGPQYNIFAAGASVVPTAPAFLRYRPPPYLRPFDLAPPLGPAPAPPAAPARPSAARRPASARRPGPSLSGPLPRSPALRPGGQS